MNIRTASRGSAIGLVAALALVAIAARVVSADALDDETRRIAKRLQCPICESVSVADSPSELAGQMRSLVRRKLEQGETDDQIVAFFVDRYGDGVLVEPPRRGLSLLVWLTPIAVLTLGGALAASLIRRWTRDGGERIRLAERRSTPNDESDSRPDAAVGEPPIEATYLDRARQELQGFRDQA